MPKPAKDFKKVSHAKEITRDSKAARDYPALYDLLIWRGPHGLRRQVLLEQRYLCAACGNLGGHVDHIEPHGGDMELFCDKRNLQVLCASCHACKTSAEAIGTHREWQASNVNGGRGGREIYCAQTTRD